MKFPHSIESLIPSKEHVTMCGLPMGFTSSSFELSKSLKPYTVESGASNSLVSVKQQVGNLQKVLDGELGALVYLCGGYEASKLFCFNYIEYVTSSRYGYRCSLSRIRWKVMPRTLGINKQDESNSVYILDAFAGDVDGKYDIVRADSIREFISKHRTHSTLMVLCPDLDPMKVQRALKHEHDIALNFKKTKQRY